MASKRPRNADIDGGGGGGSSALMTPVSGMMTGETKSAAFAKRAKTDTGGPISIE